MSARVNRKTSKRCYVPCAVSSFFEISDRNADGSRILDTKKIGARGGGFVIARGSITRASTDSSIRFDTVVINGRNAPEALTTLEVIGLMRKDHNIGHILITHEIEPPIGSGFGTSGSGALGAACSISDLFNLRLTLAQASAYAHSAEVRRLTGLGTVISLTSGSGAIGIVTEPGAFGVGRVDSLLSRFQDYTLICANFGKVDKSTVLRDDEIRQLVNKSGSKALRSILATPTPEALLKFSRIFAEETNLGSSELLRLADKAKQTGAIGATQNMIGKSIHCLVRKRDRLEFLRSFSKLVPKDYFFESELIQCGPRFLQ